MPQVKEAAISDRFNESAGWGQARFVSFVRPTMMSGQAPIGRSICDVGYFKRRIQPAGVLEQTPLYRQTMRMVGPLYPLFLYFKWLG